jgi:hypothetical protein
LPSALASFLTEDAHTTPSEREGLLAGNPLLKLLDADPSKEIAVLGAVWVDAPPGFWLVTVNHSRSDGLSGFTGRVIRGRVRSEVEDGTRAALTPQGGAHATKTRVSVT